MHHAKQLGDKFENWLNRFHISSVITIFTPKKIRKVAIQNRPVHNPKKSNAQKPWKSRNLTANVNVERTSNPKRKARWSSQSPLVLKIKNLSISTFEQGYVQNFLSFLPSLKFYLSEAFSNTSHRTVEFPSLTQDAFSKPATIRSRHMQLFFKMETTNAAKMPVHL